MTKRQANISKKQIKVKNRFGIITCEEKSKDIKIT